MSDFMSNLWESVFTPGTTPTLLLATNVTFGLLQLTLGALLVATYSIHFVILSLLCAGLWWSINWFATELQAAQVKEAEAEEIRKVRQKSAGSAASSPRAKGEWKTSGQVDDSADDEAGTETELDVSTERLRRDEAVGGSSKGTGSTAFAAQATTDTRQRATRGSLSGETSTDSEWEKVEK